MGRSLRRRRAAGDAGRDPASDLRQDRLRGLVLGAALGEALGASVAGLTRDALLRRHGRLVQMPEGASSGPVAAALASFLERAASGSAAATAADGSGTPPPIAVTLALAAARIALPPGASPPEAGIATEPGRLATRLLEAAAREAATRSPYARLLADHLLDPRRLGEATSGGGGGRDREALEQALPALGAQVLAPPAPGEARRPFAALTPPFPLALAVLQALLVRPRSSEEALVYAVNLGDDAHDQDAGSGAAARGALTGLLAGLHRGLACLPERWLLGLAGASELAQRIEPAVGVLAARGNPGGAGVVPL